MHNTIFYLLQTKQEPLNESATKLILILLIVALGAILLIGLNQLMKAYSTKSEEDLFSNK